MFSVAIGIVIGVALGLLIVGFLAIGSFDRGYESALRASHRR